MFGALIISLVTIGADGSKEIRRFEKTGTREYKFECNEQMFESRLLKLLFILTNESPIHSVGAIICVELQIAIVNYLSIKRVETT